MGRMPPLSNVVGGVLILLAAFISFALPACNLTHYMKTLAHSQWAKEGG